MTTTTKTAKWMKGVEVEDLLGISHTTLYRWTNEDYFTVIYPNGKGVGKRCYYLRDEIELYARTGKKELVAAYRRKHKRS